MVTGKILVVEDESVVAQDIQESLEDYGFEVLGPTDTGEEAIRIVENTRPDLVLMDVKLASELDGIDTVHRIQKIRSLPVVYLTAFSDKKTLERAKITEPYGYLLKPYKEIDLRTTVDFALHRFRNSPAYNGEVSPDVEQTGLDVLAEKGSEAHQSIVEALTRVKPLNDIDPNHVTDLAQYCHRKSYEACDLIALEGDHVEAGFVVIEGRVAISKSSPNGKELIVELIAPGDPFGLLCSIEKHPYPYTARAQAPSTLLWIPRKQFLQSLDTHPSLAQQFVKEMFSRLRSAHDISRSLAHDRVEVRIATALSALTPKFAIKNDSDGAPIIKMTRQELADLTGTTQETSIRVTRNFEKEGIVDLSKNGEITVLDMEMLEEIAEG